MLSMNSLSKALSMVINSYYLIWIPLAHRNTHQNWGSPALGAVHEGCRPSQLSSVTSESWKRYSQVSSSCFPFITQSLEFTTEEISHYRIISIFKTYNTFSCNPVSCSSNSYAGADSASSCPRWMLLGRQLTRGQSGYRSIGRLAK